MSQPPAFQLYAADFYMDTISWTNEEIGIYFRLLMCEWVNGPLPFEAKKLQKICQIDAKRWHKKWQKVAEKFQENGDGKLINVRLEKTREKALKYIESQKESGKRGAEKKRELGIYPFNKSSEPLTEPSRQPLSDPATQNQALQSSSSLKDKKRKNIKKESLENLFPQFWEAYPYKKSKGQAEKAWKKINPDETLLNEMLKSIEKAKRSQNWNKDNGEYIPYPASWLNARGWEDEDIEIIGGQVQGTRMACKGCGDSGQYAGIDENGLCTKCRLGKG